MAYAGFDVAWTLRALLETGQIIVLQRWFNSAEKMLRVFQSAASLVHVSLQNTRWGVRQRF